MKRQGFPLDGIILINKPQGLSSNGVLQRVKRLLQAQKAGHTGNLDPLATGMLPITLGKATKFSQYLLDSDKVYYAKGVLGKKTSTGDREGDVIQIKEKEVTIVALEAVLQSFLGTTQQVPSMFSALKYQGKPLYLYARQGIEIARSARPIIIHDITLQAFDGQEFTITVRCSKGTYIRNLIEDIGEKLGTVAYMSYLHRIYAGGFDRDSMYTLEDLQEKDTEVLHACILPIERAVMHFPSLLLTEDQYRDLSYGKSILYQGDASHSIVRLYAAQGFVGLGEWAGASLLKMKRRL